MNDQTDMNKGFLKDKLGDYQVDPPEKVWVGISAQIVGGRSRKGMFLILLASAASFALALTLGIHFFGPELPGNEAYVEEVPVVEEVSKLEQKVVETLATLPDVQVSDKDSGKVGEVQLSLAMQSIALAEQSEGMSPTDTLNEQDATQEQDALEAQDTLQEADEVPDPVVLLLEEESADLSVDPDLMLETGNKRDPRWMLGAALSPLYSFRDAQAAAIPDSPAETGMLSYSTGVHISYRRNSRFAIETGIYYNKTGIAIGAPGIQVFNQAYNTMVFGPGSEQADIRTVSNSVGNIIAYSGDIYMNGYMINAENSADAQIPTLNDVQASDQGIQQHLDYLELPFNLRYSFIDRTIELQLVGGMSANFLVNNYVSMEGPSGQEEIGYLSNVKSINYSGNAGLGMIYHLGEKLSLNLEPRFRYFINSVNDSTLPSTRPYSIGFYTGLSYTF